MSTLSISPAFRAQNRASPFRNNERDQAIRLQIGVLVSYWQQGGLDGIGIRIYAVTIGGNGRIVNNRVFNKITDMGFDAPVFKVTGTPGDRESTTLEISNIVEFRYFPLPRGEA